MFWKAQGVKKGAEHLWNSVLCTAWSAEQLSRFQWLYELGFQWALQWRLNMDADTQPQVEIHTSQDIVFSQAT